MYDTRTETYRKVFEQQKIQYCQSLPALKFLKMQEEKEQIELRKPVMEEKIAAKEREMQTLRGVLHMTHTSYLLPVKWVIPKHQKCFVLLFHQALSPTHP